MQADLGAAAFAQSFAIHFEYRTLAQSPVPIDIQYQYFKPFKVIGSISDWLDHGLWLILPVVRDTNLPVGTEQLSLWAKRVALKCAIFAWNNVLVVTLWALI